MTAFDVAKGEYAYEVRFLWSATAEHAAAGTTDEWTATDFDECLLAPLALSPVASPVASPTQFGASLAVGAHAMARGPLSYSPEAERRDATPLRRELGARRGDALVGLLLWAPPADGDGWEKIEVTRYVPGREYEYDVVYKWSENPAHCEHGEQWHDQWQDGDFEEVSLFTVTFHANPANNLTCPPHIL